MIYHRENVSISIQIYVFLYKHLIQVKLQVKLIYSCIISLSWYLCICPTTPISRCSKQNSVSIEACVQALVQLKQNALANQPLLETKTAFFHFHTCFLMICEHGLHDLCLFPLMYFLMLWIIFTNGLV